ncbi:MAG: hypothetical protein IEMM0008_1905 [bacterium]|nr:MAG: hypothetical protein IEMM0008_1905 [bacterium]
MTQGQKGKRFLVGATLIIGGLLALFFGTGPIMPFVIGGAIGLFGLILFSERSSRSAGLITLIVGGLFLANPLLGWHIITWLAVGSLLAGGYISYDTYKKINSY